MHLSSRAAVREDFTAFFDNCFIGDSDNAELRAAVAKEWEVALKNPATLTMLVEDLDKNPAERIVGCGQFVLVTEKFAQWAKSGVSPRVYMQITHPLPDNSEPLLDLAAVSTANSGDGLIALIVRWMCADRDLNAEDGRVLREYLSRSFHIFGRGYQIKEILVLCRGQKTRDLALSSGLRLRCDYADYYRAHQTQPPYTVLMGLTRDEAYENEGSLSSYSFVYTPPQFYFTEPEKDVLRRAYAGESEGEIAEALRISEAGVKDLWRNIYERVKERQSSFFEEDPSKKEGARGREKRRILLRYLQNHPEELRPFLPRGAKRTRES